MKGNLSRVLRSGVAMLLALCMVVGFIPTAAFATEEPAKKYVSLGDSMTNGYGLEGYDGNTGVEDYGADSYANQFAAEIGAEHAQLAMSAMRAEDLHWLLEVDYDDPAVVSVIETLEADEDYYSDYDNIEAFDALWYSVFTNGDFWTWYELVHDYRFDAAAYCIEGKDETDGGAFDANYKVAYNAYNDVEALQVVAAYYQKSVKEADIVSLGMGNGNFGVFMFGRITEAIGFNGKPEDTLIYNLENAIRECDESTKANIRTLMNQIKTILAGKGILADDGDDTTYSTMEALYNVLMHTVVSYVLNYAGSVEAILKLNPDAEIIQVALMNTMGGESGGDELTLSGLLDLVYVPMNAYLAALPTAMQGAQNATYADATFYWAEAPYVECIVDTYSSPLSGTVRDRFVQSIVGEAGDLGMVWGLLGNLVVPVTAQEIAFYEQSDANKLYVASQDPAKAQSIAIYLAFEQAVIDNRFTPVTVESILGLGAAMDFGAVMTAYGEKAALAAPAALDRVADAIEASNIATADQVRLLASMSDEQLKAYIWSQVPDTALASLGHGSMDEALACTNHTAPLADVCDGLKQNYAQYSALAAQVDALCTLFATPDALAEALSESEMKGLLALFGRCVIGNGIGSHPAQGGHDALAAAVVEAYESGYTSKDETEANVKIALDKLYELLQTYGPEVASQVWAQWEEYGYVALVETSITELIDTLEARYEYYTTQALPTIGTAVEELAAQKDNLTAELSPLKAQLAAKKAELAQVIADQKIGSVTAPNINIDVQLGNNQPTEIPEYDCEVEGEGIQAELEAAIRDLEHAIATIEALIAAVEADIADLVALAEQITEKVAELEQTVPEVKAAAGDLKAAFAAIEEVLTNETTDAMVDTVVASFEAARATALAAANVLDLTMDTAKMMESDINGMIAKLAADAEGLYNKFLNDLPGCIEQIPEDGMMLIGGAIYALQMGAEKAQAEIQAKLTAEKAELEAKFEVKKAELEAEFEIKKAELEAKYEEKKAELEAEYGPEIEELEGKLAGLEEQIKAEIEAKYNEVAPQIKAEYEAKIAELESKAAALEAELQAKLAEQAAAATEELRAALQPQIDRITADLNTVKADLEHAAGHLAAALEMAYEQAVAEITAAYEEAKAKLIAAIEELKAEVEAKIAEAKAALDAAVAGAKAELEAAIAAAKAELEAKIAEVKAAAEAQIEKVKAEVEAKIAALNAVGQAIVDALTATVEGIRAELQAVEDAIEGILNGSLEAVEDLKEALVALGLEGADLLVDHIVEQFNALLKTVTTADLFVKDSIKYVAIGDGTAATESYVEELTALLTAEANAKGVEKVEVVNGAKVGNTVADELANMTDVTGADLITIGFSNVDFLDKAVAAAMEGADLDWTAVVGAENVKYVEQVLDEVKAKIAEAGIEGEAAVVVNTAVEAYAYAATQYAVMVPQLVNQINAVNPEAVVVIVGMYNPMNGVAIALDENTSLEIGEYVDYLVKGVAVHGVAYAALTGNAIYVDAPAVQTVNTNTELSALDLIKMAYNKFEALYPSAEGDDYIAAQIAAALNIVVEEEDVLLGDADGNGVINTLDAMRVLKYYTGELVDGEIVLGACDVDGENGINTVDALYILQYYTGDVTEFPAAK